VRRDQQKKNDTQGGAANTELEQQSGQANSDQHSSTPSATPHQEESPTQAVPPGKATGNPMGLSKPAQTGNTAQPGIAPQSGPP